MVLVLTFELFPCLVKIFKNSSVKANLLREFLKYLFFLYIDIVKHTTHLNRDIVLMKKYRQESEQ